MRVAALLVVVTGCSGLFMVPPAEPTSAGEAPVASAVCTSSRALPVADTVIAGTSLVAGTGLALAAANQPGGDYDIAKTILVLSSATAFAYAVFFTASAYYGYRTADRCRAEHSRDPMAAR